MAARKKQKKKAGRPRQQESGRRRQRAVKMLFTDAELDELKAEAAREMMALSTWAQRVLLSAVRQPNSAAVTPPAVEASAKAAAATVRRDTALRELEAAQKELDTHVIVR